MHQDKRHHGGDGAPPVGDGMTIQQKANSISR